MSDKIYYVKLYTISIWQEDTLSGKMETASSLSTRIVSFWLLLLALPLEMFLVSLVVHQIG
jgi:hypothetical protein